MLTPSTWPRTTQRDTLVSRQWRPECSAASGPRRCRSTSCSASSGANVAATPRRGCRQSPAAWQPAAPPAPPAPRNRPLMPAPRASRRPRSVLSMSRPRGRPPPAQHASSGMRAPETRRRHPPRRRPRHQLGAGASLVGSQVTAAPSGDPRTPFHLQKTLTRRPVRCTSTSRSRCPTGRLKAERAQHASIECSSSPSCSM